MGECEQIGSLRNRWKDVRWIYLAYDVAQWQDIAWSVM